jgi:uncharacterized protein (DUF433 family)
MILSNEHIVSDPDMCFGKPRIAGSRFSVKDVVGHHQYSGLPLEIIAAKWKLPLAGVYAAMAYYFDHKAEIDQSFSDDDAFYREMKAKRRSALGDITLLQ